jgi:hypothetical protein
MSHPSSDVPDQPSQRRASSTTIRLRILTGYGVIEPDVNPDPPLGWRFWTLSGFPGDPVDPRPYGGTRCVLIAMVERDGCDRWLCAMERDESFQTFASHELFPCADQSGVEAFARRMIADHAIEPRLL